MSDIKDLLKGIQENIPLAPYTTFKIGGPAKYFYIAKITDEIKQAVRIAKDIKLSYYIMGNGSNILVSDQGFEGLVIKLQNKEFSADIESKRIKAGAGIGLGVLVRESIGAGLSGLEWAIGIPGTLGGAIYGNAGAFGHSISEVIESVEVVNTDNLKEEVLTGYDCKFSYRYSIFKEKKYIILSAILKLAKASKEETEKIKKEYLAKRQGKHPIGPSAGSVFKNPLISENQKAYEKLLKKFPESENFKINGKIPAGWLIEEYGLKGKKIGGAVVSEKHGNFIINAASATSEDVIMLISLIKQKIRVNFGIQLEEEIQYVGF